MTLIWRHYNSLFIISVLEEVLYFEATCQLSSTNSSPLLGLSYVLTRALTEP